MKVLKYIFSMMLLGGIISACADLDTKLTNEWSESDTWRDADMAQGVLLSVYQDVMIAPDAWDGNFLDAATDNALTRNYDSKVYRASQGHLVVLLILLAIGAVAMISFNGFICSWIKG